MRFKMRRNILLAALAIFSFASAHAQVAVYVTSSSSRFSNVASGEIVTYQTTGNVAEEQYDNFWTSGIGGGASLRWLSLGPLNLSFDLRGSTQPGTPGGDTALGGLKFGIKAPGLRLKPYIQASGGYLGTRTVNVNSTATYPYPPVGGTLANHYAGWEILGGVDYPLFRLVDLRLIEIGAGRGYSTSAPSITALTINTGLVFHF
jgi:hypothetical protein